MVNINDTKFRQILLNRMKELCRPMQPEPTRVDPQLSRMPGIRVVIFDIYGTLLTSEAGEIGSLSLSNAVMAQSALQDAGFRFLDKRTGKRAVERLHHWIDSEHRNAQKKGIQYPEVDILEIWKLVLNDLAREKLIRSEKHAQHEMFDTRAVQRLAVEYECRVNPTWPMPDLRITLKGLLKTGIKLGIVSNAQFYTSLVMESFYETGWIEKFFEPGLCIESWQVGESKPSARLIRLILEQLAARYGLTPDKTLCIGNDMLNDITPAIQMGCKTALFAGDRKSLRLRADDPHCSDITPDLIITELKQLLDVLC